MLQSQPCLNPPVSCCWESACCCSFSDVTSSSVERQGFLNSAGVLPSPSFFSPHCFARLPMSHSMNLSITLCSLNRVSVRREYRLKPRWRALFRQPGPSSIRLKCCSSLRRSWVCRTAGDGYADRDCDDVRKVVTTRIFNFGD